MQRPSSRRRRRPEPPPLHEVLIELLDLFSVIDDCFTEDDALTAAKRQMTVGRIYRAWKKTRLVMDPWFDERILEEHQRLARIERRAGKADRYT